MKNDGLQWNIFSVGPEYRQNSLDQKCMDLSDFLPSQIWHEVIL